VQTPLFVPFNVRNQIINENCTRQKDIIEFPTNKQYQILLSYMPEKSIYSGIQKRINDKLHNVKARNSLSTPYEVFQKGWTEDQIKEWIRTHPIRGGGNMGNSFISFKAGFDDTGLKAYWKFNEASGNIINQSQDASKIANSDMVVSGMTYISSGGDSPFGFQGSFDGTDDRIDASSANDADFGFLNHGGTQYSINTWYKTDDFAAGRFLFGNGDGNQTCCQFIYNSNRKMTLLIHDGNSLKVNYDTTLLLPNDTNWHMLTFTVDDTINTATFNIDAGTRETNSSLGDLVGTNNPANDFTIGTRSVSPSNYFKGDIAEFAMFDDRILSTTEEGNLYNSGNGREIY